MDNNEIKDKSIEKYVKEARLGSTVSRKKLYNLTERILTSMNATIDTDILDYIVLQLVDKKYCQQNSRFSFDDSILNVGAMSIPAKRSNGQSFYTCGDSHFFYKPDSKTYVLGLMDGKDHGPCALMITLSARKHLDDIVQRGILNPIEMAEALNTKMRTSKIGFTTIFMSILKDKHVSVTNTGSEAFLYRANAGILHKFHTSGIAPGIIDTNTLRQRNPYIAEEINLVPYDVLVAYTDGIYEHEGFNIQNLQKCIQSGQKAINIAENINLYAASLPKQGSSDDATVTVAIIK